MRKFSRTLIQEIRNNEDGAVMIMAVIVMVAMLGMAAISIDIGMAYLRQGQLQKALDAAVYSAGRELPVSVTDITAQNAIKDSAIRYSALNGYGGVTRDDVVLAGVVSDCYTDIQITASDTAELSFSRIFGIDTLDFSKSAKAKVSPVKSSIGVAPLGVEKLELIDRIDRGDLTHVVLKYGNGDGDGPSFGALDLDGTGGGASDYRLWISHGYFGEICIGDVLVQELGNMAGPTYSGFSDRFDGCTHYDAPIGGEGCTVEHYDPTCSRIITIVVYTPGDNHTVVVDGFAAFLLEAQDEKGYITGSFLNMVNAGSTTGGDLSEDSYYGLYNLMLIE